jgi:hypothetical protein
MAGGGVASSCDHIDVMQYTEAERRAAVEAVANWGTYVMAQCQHTSDHRSGRPGRGCAAVPAGRLEPQPGGHHEGRRDSKNGLTGERG